MASVVDLCNIALSHLGARAQVSSIAPPDGSVEAGYCARFYPIARREVIEAGNWSFSKKRVALAAVTNESTVWAYAYALPSDCMMALRVLRLQYIADAAIFWPLTYEIGSFPQLDLLFTERGSADFEIEGSVIYTNEPEAVLLYKRDITDTTKFTPLMTSAVGMVLAGYLAGPIIKSIDGARVGAQWREQGYRMVAKAAASDANASSENNEFIPGQLAVR